MPLSFLPLAMHGRSCDSNESSSSTYIIHSGKIIVGDFYVFVKRMKCHSKFIKKFHQSISLYDFHNYHYVHIDSPPMFYPEINWPSIWMSRPNHADLEERLAMALLLLLLILGSQQMYHNIFLLFILVT